MTDKKMLVIDEAPCSCCKAEFIKKDLDDQRRCPHCAGLGLAPGLKPEQQIIQQPQPKPTKEELKSLIREVLAEMKVEWLPEMNEEPKTYAVKVCKVCGKEFTPTAPAQKRCLECLAATKD